MIFFFFFFYTDTTYSNYKEIKKVRYVSTSLERALEKGLLLDPLIYEFYVAESKRKREQVSQD